jgi:hypothetical protein
MPTAGDRRVSPPKSCSCRVAVDNREHAVLPLNHLRVFLEYSLISSGTYGSNQFVANGKADDFAEARESQFVHDVIVVAIDRPRRDTKRRGNFLVALSSGEERTTWTSRGVSDEMGRARSSHPPAISLGPHS